jgi:hypothetical protein
MYGQETSHQWPPPMETDRKFVLDILGSRTMPATAAAKANTEAAPKAGMLPLPNSKSHGDDHLGHHDGDVEHPDAQPLAPALALRQLRRHGERDATQDLLHIYPGINRVNHASSSNGREFFTHREGEAEEDEERESGAPEPFLCGGVLH